LKKITKEKKTIGAKRKEPHQSKKKRKHKRQRGAKKEPHQKKRKKEKKIRSACILSRPMFAELYHCLLELDPGQV
jgi:hypothetical protein